MKAGLLASIVWWLGASHQAQAHTVDFGMLRFVEVSNEMWRVTLSVGASSADAMGLSLALPNECQLQELPAVQSASGVDRHWRMQCALWGEVGFDELPANLQVQLRLEPLVGRLNTQLLTAREPTVLRTRGPTNGQTTSRYLELGVQHILEGVDHLLFLVGLVFLVGLRGRRLLMTVTAFTVGHSITLCLATLGHLRVEQAITEAIIALSVLTLAVELRSSGPPTWGQRFPWLVAGGFGLIHGLGFAGALAGVGLPEHALALALTSFNVGVELGQLVFVAVVAGALWLARGKWPDVRFASGAAYGLALCSTYWLLERLTA